MRGLAPDANFGEYMAMAHGELPDMSILGPREPVEHLVRLAP